MNSVPGHCQSAGHCSSTVVDPTGVPAIDSSSLSSPPVGRARQKGSFVRLLRKGKTKTKSKVKIALLKAKLTKAKV